MKSFSAQHPLIALAILVAVTAASVLELPHLATHFEMEDFFPMDSPERERLEWVWDRFGRDDRHALLILEATEPFTFDDFKIIDEVTRRLEERKDIEAVTSPTSIEFIKRGDNKRIRLRRALEETDGPSRAKALHETLQKVPYRNGVLSEDGRVAVIAAILKPDHVSSSHRLVLREGLEREARWLEDKGGYTARIAGYPMHRLDITNLVARDSRELYPWVMGVIALLLLLIFRSPIGVLDPLLTGACAVVWMLGLMSVFSIAINFLCPAVMILMVVVSVADCIHLSARIHERCAVPGCNKAQAIADATRDMWLPCLLTSVTTAIVFAGLALTGIPLIVEFGLAVSLGVLSTFVVTFLLLPPLYLALNRLGWLRPRSKEKGSERFLPRLDAWVSKHHRAIVLSTAALTIAALFGISAIEKNSPLLADIEPSHPVVKTNEFIDDRLGGLVPVDVLVKRPDAMSRADFYGPKHLEKIESLGERLRGLDGIRTVIGPMDLLNRFSESLHPDPTADTPKAVELLPGAILLVSERLTPWVNTDDDVLRVQLRTANLNTGESMRLYDEIREVYQDELGREPIHILSGQGYLGQTINDEIVGHFATSFWAGLALIFLLLLAAFRDFRMALLALTPNVVPLLWVAGVMGIAGIELRYSSALVLTVAFGLAVDDTIHFVAQLRSHLHSKTPVRSAICMAGPGIIVSSLVLAAGFSVLLLSDFVPNQVLGLLLSLTAIFALVSDLVFFPAAIRLFLPAYTARQEKVRLVQSIVPADALSSAERDEMYALFLTYYEQTHRTRFDADLDEKTTVILLKHPQSHVIKGFSTVQVIPTEFDGSRSLTIYSGDTVVHRDYWGQRVLQAGFNRVLISLRVRNPGTPIHWLLTTKGYKTYLLMRRNFSGCFPNRSTNTPKDVTDVITELGQLKFGERFNSDSLIIHSNGASDRVRDGVADIEKKHLEDPDIRFFAERNPGYRNGDELICVARVGWKDMFRLLRKSISRTLFPLKVR